MNLFIWIATGALLGGIASPLVARGARPEYRLNIVTGIVGALLGGCLLAPLFGNGAIDIHHFSSGKWMTAAGSALALLFLFNLLRANKPLQD